VTCWSIEVSPKITLPQQDPSLMGVTVSINGADQRPDQASADRLRRSGQSCSRARSFVSPALPAAGSADRGRRAKVTRDNQQVTLTASRDLRFLLQEVLEKQMTARGYMMPGPDAGRRR
jgi:uncharacterized lipoprotein